MKGYDVEAAFKKPFKPAPTMLEKFYGDDFKKEDKRGNSIEKMWKKYGYDKLWIIPKQSLHFFNNFENLLTVNLKDGDIKTF